MNKPAPARKMGANSHLVHNLITIREETVARISEQIIGAEQEIERLILARSQLMSEIFMLRMEQDDDSG